MDKNINKLHEETKAKHKFEVKVDEKKNSIFKHVTCIRKLLTIVYFEYE